MLNVFEELTDTSRRQILSELRSGAKNVSDLCESTHLKQPNVSNHLARMRARGIVHAEKCGRQVFYSLVPEVEAVVNSVLEVSASPAATVDFPELVKRYAKAAIAGDEAVCGEIMDIAFRARMPLIDIYQDLLGPAMAMIGTWWTVDAIDEAQEHMATEITHRMMARTSQIAGPRRKNGKVAVLGCAPNCWHVIGLRMISDYLRLQGWRTLFMGPNVPERSFLSTVNQNQPTLVLLSVNSPDGQASTISLIRSLHLNRTKRCDYKICVGGIQVSQNPDMFEQAGTDFIASDLRQFASVILPSVETPDVDRQLNPIDINDNLPSAN